MKTSKKLLVVVLALVMILACAVPAFADPSDPGSYVQSGSYSVTGKFNVTLTIQSYATNSMNPISRYYYTVDMGTAGVTNTFTVKDVLVRAAAKYSWLSFEFGSDSAHPGAYLYGVKDTSKSSNYLEAMIMYRNSTAYYNGWMFRINGMIPMVTTTNSALITEAYVSPGDNITLYYANADTQGTSANFAKLVYDSANSSSTTIAYKVLVSNCYYDNGSSWTIEDYSTLAENSTVTVYIDNDSTGQSKTVDANGNITFAISSFGSGSHTIWLSPTYLTYTNGSTTYYVLRRTGALVSFQIN